MGLLNGIVGILAIYTPTLVPKETVTYVSIAVLVGLLVFHYRNTLLGSNPGGRGESSNCRKTSLSSRFKEDVREVNDSLYELYKPDGDPTMQILFFHGLPFGEYSDAPMSTWTSGDGSCIWPKVWLAKEFPNAHILVVSYNDGPKVDMRIIRENLTSDLIQANVGQTANCPVILVGHSFGGLVIKDLCIEAHNSLISPAVKAKVQKFLDNLRGIFYYSTPHHGSAHIGRAASVLSGPLFKYFTVLSTDTSRLNYDFNRLRNCYPKWQIGGLGEHLAVKTGLFQGIVVVEEESARDGVTFNIESGADHFSVCKPEKKTSRSFNALTSLLQNICDDLKDEQAIAQKQAVRQNLQHLPKHMVHMDELLEEVKSRLKKFTTLGFVGMGGLGKTTLAKAVFNELSPTFEYSCFVPDLKLIKGTVEEGKQVVWKHMHRFGRKVGDKDDLSDLIGKGQLLVFDNISDDRDITLLSHLVDNSSPRSRFIVTSRNWDLLNRLDDIDIYQVPLLDHENAQKLFLSHSFPSQLLLPANLERDMVAVVAKCGGLPLTLEVLGRYLKLKKDGKFWKQTLQALEKAEAIQDLDNRLWAKLRVSYDGLDEVEKQMFLDATTFFSESRNGRRGYLSLREAKAAWRAAYGTECETLRWQTLVDRSLVYDVGDNQSLKVHDQLLSLGQRIASESSKNGKCRIWEEKMGSKLLKEDLEAQDIHALRLSYEWSDSHGEEIHISSHALFKLKQLQYLEVDGTLIVDGVEEDRSFPSKLCLLKWVGPLHTFDLALQDHLVVLHLSGAGVLPSSIGQLSALRIFIGEFLRIGPDEFGDLSQLEYLEMRWCAFLDSLPETFGKLSQLEYLKFRSPERLESLPETFGNLSNLQDLEFNHCSDLRSLPESFCHLSALNHLVLRMCSKLVALPSSFGNLSALDNLVFSHCDRLVALPNSFGNLSALKHLKISHCDQLHALPDSIGNLFALKHLKIGYCDQLRALPDSFGSLLALEDLKLSGCHFEALPNSFGKLSSLRHLELKDCGKFLSVIPFSQLTQLQYLEISGNTRLIQMEKLPDSLAELTAVCHLVLDCVSIRSIPEFMKSMQSLHTLELSRLPYIKELPHWLGETGVAPLALSRKMFQVQEGRFSLTSEEYEIKNSEWLVRRIHENAMEKVEESDYEGALAYLCPEYLGVLEPKLHRFLLQERGIARRFTGDFQGALEDLTAALEVFSDADDGNQSLYDCRRHRGYVKFLLGDLDGALKDGEMALKLISCDRCRPSEKLISPNLGEELVTYMHFKLHPTRDLDEQNTPEISVHSQVIRMCVHLDFSGALRMWEDFDARVSCYFNRVYFLQERGVLKRLAGDLQGAVDDLTATLEILSEGGDNCCEDHCWRKYMYNCRRHLGYLKFLLGNRRGAQEDGANAVKLAISLKLLRGHYRLGWKALGGKSVTWLMITRKNDYQDELMRPVHSQMMEKVTTSDFAGALAIWCAFDASVSSYYDRAFFLQERGILRRMAGDLPGALRGLTAALEGQDESDDEFKNEMSRVLKGTSFLPRALVTAASDYELLKHRGYVKYLMGDEDGARRDAEKCLAMEPKLDGLECLGGLPVAFLEFRLKGRVSNEYQLQ